MGKTRYTAPLFALLSLLGGSEWILADSLRGSSPLAAASLCCLTAGAALLPFAWSARRRSDGNRCGYIYLTASLGIGVGLIAAPRILLFFVAARAGFAVRAIIFAAVPLMVASWRAGARRMQAPCLGGLTGIALLAANGLNLTWRAAPSLLAVLLASVLIAATLVFAERVWNRTPLPPLAASVCVQLLAAGVVLLLASLAAEPRAWSAYRFVPAGPAWALALGAVSTGAGLLLFFRLLGVLPAVKLASIAWGQILVTTFEAAWLFRQRLDWQMLLGVAVTLGSLVLLLRAETGPDADPLLLRITNGT